MASLEVDLESKEDAYPSLGPMVRTATAKKPAGEAGSSEENQVQEKKKKQKDEGNRKTQTRMSIHYRTLSISDHLETT